MLSALYYPYTNIGSKDILKNALLLWDHIETIVPTRDSAFRLARQEWPSEPKSEIKLLREAEELVVRHRIATTEERDQAHKTLETMVDSGHLSKLVQQSPTEWRDIGNIIHSEKFFHRTWAMLERRGLAQWIQEERDYGVPAAVGLLMMLALADSCAGTKIQTITDRAGAYTWLAKQRANLLGTQHINDLNASEITPDHDRLVALSLDAVDGRRIDLRALVELRKRELRSGGNDYSAMRQRYSKAMAAHIERIKTEAKSGGDIKELNRQFKNEIKQDVSDLKSELGIATIKSLFSTGVVVSVVLTAGCVISPIEGLTTLAREVGGLGGIIPLLKAAADYRGARREALKKHAMSWLFLAKQRRIQAY
ncbi:hypothetical protein [Corallococcus exiguus]|uniref:hypothetical protein n=1 Tax=Corallococcus exiguus TaxID=83462 RepID=UPI003DA285F6